MANLPELSQFDQVYQLETNDYVVGGLNGVSNAQAKQLANRTLFLRNLINDAGIPEISLLSGSVNDIVKTGFYYAKPSNGLPNVPGTGGSFSGFLLHMQAVAGENASFQVLYFLSHNVAMLRSKIAGAWGAWVPMSGGAGITGMIAIFPVQAAPSGWLACNGALASRGTYADLWNTVLAIGPVVSEAAWTGGQYGAFSVGDGSTTFRLPDLRGEFIRGWDNGRGVDAGRVIGALQGQSIESHTHANGVYNKLMKTDGVNTRGPDVDNTPGEPNLSAAQPMLSYGGAETRPRNIALGFYIKY